MQTVHTASKHCIYEKQFALHMPLNSRTHLSHLPHDEWSPIPVCIAEAVYIQGNLHPSPSASLAGTFPLRTEITFIMNHVIECDYAFLFARAFLFTSVAAVLMYGNSRNKGSMGVTTSSLPSVHMQE